ncbi:MAG: DUF962 domain-containing protein [Chryseobacterium sp.]|nr:MAG: DUF962 domain-containing protein [Chryseobacterium sp.]
MKKVDALFAQYGDSHRNATNELIHWVCVPAIFFSIIGFVSLISGPVLTVGIFGISAASAIVLALVVMYYARLSAVIAAIMLLLMLVAQTVVYQINIHNPKAWVIYAGIFAVSWVFQFIGHKIEGKKPSFLTDIFFLLIGPIWLLHFVLNKLKISY